MKTKEDIEKDRNEDPITGEPGAHPVGVGIGTAGGAAAGAAIGAVGGPVGVVAGAIIGGVAGGYAGKAGGEAVNPTEEDAYWEQNHAKQDYATPEDKYEDYLAAYRAGYMGPARYGSSWDEAESKLEREWEEEGKSRSGLEWERAKHAVRAGWHRVEKRLPGDADGDGR
jgi:hypothetical protein